MNDRRALSIRAKVIATCVGLALTTGFAGGLGIWAISRVNTAFQVVATQSLPAMNDLLQAERDMQQALVAERSLMFMSLATPETKQHVKVHAGELAQVLERWREYTAIPASDAERGLWPAFNAAVREWEQASRDAVRVLSEDTPSARRDAIDLSMGEGAVKFENARKILSELTAIRIAQVESHARTEETRAARMLWWVVSAVLGAMALALVLSVVLARAIARPLGQTVTLLRDIAEGEGDLTQRLEVRSRDELGELARWFNIFVDKLRVIIGQTRESAERAALAAQQLSTGTEQISGAAQEQASSLEETAASMEELTGTVKQNADNARQASQLAVESRDTAERGGQVVASAVASMDEITAASTEQSQGIEQVNKAIVQMDRLVQSSAAQTEELSSTALALAVHAKQLRALVWRFKLADGAPERPPAETGPDATLEPAPSVAARASATRTRTLPTRLLRASRSEEHTSELQ